MGISVAPGATGPGSWTWSGYAATPTLFNARNWDALRALFGEKTRLDVASRYPAARAVGYPAGSTACRRSRCSARVASAILTVLGGGVTGLQRSQILVTVGAQSLANAVFWRKLQRPKLLKIRQC